MAGLGVGSDAAMFVAVDTDPRVGYRVTLGEMAFGVEL